MSKVPPVSLACTGDLLHLFFLTNFTITTRSVLHKVGLTWDRKNGLLPGVAARGNNTLEEKQKRGRFPVVAKSRPPEDVLKRPPPPSCWAATAGAGLPQLDRTFRESPSPLYVPDLHADVNPD